MSDNLAGPRGNLYQARYHDHNSNENKFVSNGMILFNSYPKQHFS